MSAKIGDPGALYRMQIGVWLKDRLKRTPTSFQTRAFPFQIDGLRGPGLTYVNMNVVRNFQRGGRRTFQARVDIQNLLNYAAYNPPITDPTNSNFGKVTTAVASAGAMRFFNFVMRFTF